jgi:AbrB family looped-hinge helix DNA binding protein
MQTKVSTKGQVVIPGPLRRRLGIRAGDPLDANIEAGSIVLTPRKVRQRQAKIIADPLTGLPVLSAGDGAPALSSKEVEEILANFP